MKQMSFIQVHDTPRVRDFPVEERPANRLAHYGPGALSTTELIATILQTPNALYQAQQIAVRFGGLMGLARASLTELQSIVGVGPVKAAQIKAALELGRRLMIQRPEEKPQVRSPADAANLLMGEMAHLEQEHLRVMLLDTKNHVLAIPTIYVGSTNTALVRVAEILRPAIRANAVGIIIVHNHPSGDPTPSPEDIRLTELIRKAGELADIEVLDHLIIGQQRYVSLKERGLGFG